jgi:hypothetical protein
MAKAAIIRLADYRKNTQAETNIRDKLDADKLAKDSVEVEKKSLTTTEILNKNLEQLAKVIKDQGMVGKVTDKAQQTKFYGGAGGAVKERVENIKEFFTLRGFLDKTGIVEKGSKGFIGGIADKALERREAKQQYVKDMMKTDPTVRLMGEDKAKKVFKKRFDKSQEAGIDLQTNEKEITRLKEAGLTEEQIKRSPEYKKKAQLEGTLAKIDPRFRGSDTIGGGALKESAAKLRGSNVIPLKKDDVKEVEGNLSEEEIENLRMMEEQNEVLKQIEENTRPKDARDPKPEKKEDEGGLFSFGGIVKRFAKKLGGMLLSGLMSLGSMLGSGIATAAKFLLNPAVLGKLITRVFPIVMIVGALVNGLWDGIKTFLDGGSLGDAIIAGLGGILEFLSFGLFDADTIKGMVESFTGFVDEYITKPLGNFFKNIKDAVAGFFENIGIPEISFSVFGKKIAFGPWYPFKPGDNPPGAEAPPEGNQPARVEGADQTKATSAAPAAAPTGNKVSSEKQALQEAAIQSQLSNAKKAEEQAMFETNPARKKALLEGAKRAREEVAVLKGNKTQDETEKRYQEKLAKAPKNLRDDVGYQNNLRDRAEMEVRAERRNKVATQPSTNAGQVYNKSAENQARKEQKAPASNTVVAPQTNVNNNSQTMPVYYAPRNNDSTVNDYVKRRAVG